MANFMGPMAPPQAAPQQPPQMDVKTSPTQRAQFKSFMRSMSAPTMPQVLPNIGMGVPSPDQNMAPMPTNPMMNVDIFSQPVQYMAAGGYAGSGMERGRGGTGMGDVGFSGAPSVSSPSIGSGEGGGSKNDALADILAPATQQSFSMPPIDILQNALNIPNVGSNLPSPIQGAMNFMSQGVTMPGPMGLGTLNVQPTFSGSLSDPNLGIMGNYTLNFEDGGAVTVPKSSDVRGIPHKLAYITEEEAGILKALGGTGEMHKGIPSYRPANDTGAGVSGAAVGAAAAGAAGAGSSSGSGNGNDGGGADNSNNGVDFGGTAFGIDGVSATGSTATDAAIGYTSGEGSNTPGANFSGLTGAPSSVVADAVSAAAQAAKGGGDLSAQQSAATNVVSGGLAPDVAAVSALGGQMTDTDVDMSGVMGLLSDLNIAPTQTEQTTETQQTTDPVSSLLASLAEESMMNDLNAYNAENQANAQAQQAMNNTLAAFGYVGPTATEAQQVQTQAPDVSAVYGGYEDDPGYAADLFGVPAYSGGSFGLDGDTFGFGNMQEAGAFVEGAMAPAAFAQQMMESTPSLMGIGLGLLGQNLTANQQQAIQNMLAEGAQFNEETGRLESPTASGVISMNPYGMVTYSGMPDNSYSGAFSHLVNSRPDPQTGMDVGAIKPIASDIQSEDVTQTAPNQFGGIFNSATNPLVDQVVAPEANQQTQVTTPAVKSVVVPSTRTTSPFFMRPQASFDPSQILTAEYFRNLLTPSRPIGMQKGGSVIDAAAEKFLGSLRAA